MARLGSVEIDVDLSTKQLEKDIDKARRELEKLDRESERLQKQKISIEVETSQAEGQFDRVANEIARLQKELDKPRYMIDDKEYSKMQTNLDAAIIKSDVYGQKISSIKDKENLVNNALEKNKQNHREIIELINELIAKKQEAAKQPVVDDEETEKSGVKIDKIIKKVARLGLAVFGVRGAFTAVRRAMSSYLGDNQVTANKLSSVWVALGNLIGPIIEKIANWVLKLIGYLNVFVKTVSRGKIDLTKNMGKNTKAVKGTTGAMKELNKQLAQFDEATVLQDQKLDSGGSGGLDSDAFDMPELNQEWVEKIQAFGKWVLDNWPMVLTLLGGIGALFAIGTVGKWLGGISSLIGIGGTGIMGAGGSGLLGIATVVIALTALYIDLKSAIDEAADAAKQDFDNRAKEGPKSVEVTEKVVDILKDANATEEDHVEALRNVKSQLKGTSKNAKEYSKNIKDTTGGIYEFGYAIGFSDEALKENRTYLNETVDKTNKYVDAVKEAALADTLTADEKQELIQLLLEERNGLRDTKRNLQEGTAEYKRVDGVIDNLNNTIKLLGGETCATTVTFDKFGMVVYEDSEGMKEFTDKVINSNSMLKKFNEMKVDNKKSTFIFDANTAQAESGISGMVSGIARKMQNAFNTLNFNVLKQNLANQLSSIFPNIQSSIKRAFGLAKGGIINLPGPGVPLAGGVVGGERAPEGVIPYTDSQVMEVLGEAIGKYITVNASITNTMNGRVISRELQKINNENDFMSNR